MKGILVVFALFSFTFVLAGCIHGWRNIDERELLEDTVKIEQYSKATFGAKKVMFE